jgi:hypothetical protein
VEAVVVVKMLGLPTLTPDTVTVIGPALIRVAVIAKSNAPCGVALTPEKGDVPVMARVCPAENKEDEMVAVCEASKRV